MGKTDVTAMKRATRTFVIVAVSAVVACSSQTSPASTPTTTVTTLRLFATHTTAPLVADLAAEYTAQYPDRLSNILIINHTAFIQQMSSGETSYIFSTHLPIEANLWARPIAQDAIAIVVHPNNPVQNLANQQLRAVYQGIINNWSELGGMDAPIIVISREDGADIRLEFERLIMGQRLTTTTARLATSDKAVIAQVSANPQAIGYVSLGWLDTSLIKPLSVDNISVSAGSVADNTYPLRSTIFVLGLNEPKEAYQDFIAWAQSADGQAIIKKVYAQLP